MQRHRTGPLKQHNKAHNSRFSSKGAIKKKQKGRSEGKASVATTLVSAEQSKLDRRNHGKQLAQNAREALVASHRAISTGKAAPRLIAFIPLTSDSDSLSAMDLCKQATQKENKDQPNSNLFDVMRTDQGQRLVFANCKWGSNISALDLCKVADVVVLVLHLSPDSGTPNGPPLLTAEAESMINLLKSQGIPSSACVVQGFSNLKPSKRINEAKAMLRTAIEFHLPDCLKPLPLDTENEAKTAIRLLSAQMKPKSPVWREGIPYMLIEKVNIDKQSHQAELIGFIRGNVPLSANRLVHLTAIGTFKMSKIIDRTTNSTDVSILAEPHPEKQESIVYANDPAPSEQTWPTEEEERMAEKIQNEMKKKTKKVLVDKGTSSYQAAWLIDDDEAEAESVKGGGVAENDETMESEEEEEEEEEEEVVEEEEEENKNDQDEGKMEDESDEEAGNEDGNDDDDDDDDDDDEIEKWRKSREDSEFPDEVEVPKDVNARVKFMKYRGLKSFRTSPWDPKQDLPIEYSRIFQFSNYKFIAKKVCDVHSLVLEGGVSSGNYVGVFITDVSDEIIEKFANRNLMSNPLVLSGLRKHENRASVVHFSVKRVSNYADPIKSRELVWFQAGFRRFPAMPAFSETIPGISKQKFLRFLQPGITATASIYGPICYSPCPILIFHGEPKDNNNQDSISTTTAAAANNSSSSPCCLIATGSLIDVEPNRILCKKVVLTALPFKIHRRHVVARGMFYSPEDVNWFKPVELRTKLGHVGTILEPIGTHGHMRCLFESPLRANDTICMSLYKRVFPKWI